MVYTNIQTVVLINQRVVKVIDSNCTNFFGPSLVVAQAAANTLVSMFYAILPAGLIVVFVTWGIQKFKNLTK